MDVLEDILQVLEKYCFSSSILASDYIFPCEDEQLHEQLLGEGGVINTDDYLHEHAPDFLNKQREFKKLLDETDFNPYKYYQANEYFVKTKCYSDLDKIFTIKKYPNLVNNFIHIGDRGSGKTVLQNCWLYRNNSKLEEEKIFWVRCDGHKLYNLWLDHEGIVDDIINDTEIDTLNDDDIAEIKIEELVNIEEYFDIQLVYVFSKYILKSERKLFQKINLLLKNDSPQFYMPVSKSTEHTDSTDLYKRLLHLNNIITKEETDQKTGYSYAFDKVMYISQKTMQIDKRKWIYTSKALQKFLHKNDFWILRIIDGVDNVHINQIRAKKFYKFMLNQVSNFAFTPPPEKTVNFLAIRERTYFELGDINPIIKNSSANIKKIIHDTPPIKDVIDRRYEFAINNLFSNDEGIFHDISSSIIRLLPNENNENSHNNVRSFLHNKMSLMSLVYYRVMQLGGNKTNIPSQVENLSYRNRYLNGRLFLNTKKQWSELNFERGLCCFNIFYFDNEKFPPNDLDNWYGLCKIRLLQLLLPRKLSPEKATKIYLIEFLSSAFGYPKKLIEKNIYDLRAFGLIDSKFDDFIYYETSKKGVMDLTSTFNSIDTLYYFALDTPLPIELLKLNLIDAHSNKFNLRTRYPFCSLITSITFLIFLRGVAQTEQDKYERYKQENGCNISLSILRLPIDDKRNMDILHSSIAARIETVCNDGDGDKLTQYIKDLKLAIELLCGKENCYGKSES